MRHICINIMNVMRTDCDTSDCQTVMDMLRLITILFQSCTLGIVNGRYNRGGVAQVCWSIEEMAEYNVCSRGGHTSGLNHLLISIIVLYAICNKMKITTSSSPLCDELELVNPVDIRSIANACTSLYDGSVYQYCCTGIY